MVAKKHLPSAAPLMIGLVAFTAGLIGAALRAQDKSVNPGINKSFQEPKVTEFLERFEKEGREIYDRREEIVRACGLTPGLSLADVGAGTGLFTRLFAREVGAEGRVFAVDIAPNFVRHIEDSCRADGIKNVIGVVCPQDSVNLPRESVDVAFICDVYHHFEFPFKTMRSLHAALRPGGRLILIDFHRLPGVSSEWAVNHVRASQELFLREIISCGFRRAREATMLKDNYFVELVKVETPPRSEFSEAVTENGLIRHSVTSSWQAGPTEIRVLLPEPPADTAVPVVYLLPVEAGRGNQYGDALAEIQRLGLHRELGVMFVAPTFSALPWYADHPDDVSRQQETYFVHEVVPFIERTYGVQSEPDGRLLVGFSKSGWGAFSLLLRHPGLFGRAVAFDAPLMLDRHDQFGSGPIFGSPENFQRYRLTNLIRAQSRYLGKAPRLFFVGDGNFRSQHADWHVLLDELSVPHRHVAGTERRHAWDGGWLEEAVRLAVAPQP